MEGIGYETALSILLRRLMALIEPLDGASDLLEALNAAGAPPGLAMISIMAGRDCDVGNVSYAIHALIGSNCATNVSDLSVWIAQEADLKNSRSVGALIRLLDRVETHNAVRVLCQRAAEGTTVADPRSTSFLILALFDVGSKDDSHRLATRAARDTSLDKPREVARILSVIRKVGAREASAALIARKPASYAYSDDSGGSNRMFRELRLSGNERAASQFLINAVDSGADNFMFEELIRGTPLIADRSRLQKYGRQPDARPSMPWGWDFLLHLQK